jgi:hypothetical protein
VQWSNSQPNESGQVVSSAQHGEWSVAFGLRNDGPVAPHFVALHIVFGTGVDIYSAGAGEWLAPWRPRSLLATSTDELWWEGGADAVVHPSWVYDVPELGRTALRLAGPQLQTEFTFDVEVVADDVPAFKHTYTIKVPRDK